MIHPPLQERHYDYVIGPNQDSRLASVAAGTIIDKIKLQTDGDAPFELRSRAVRCAYDASLTQTPLIGLTSQWTGPTRDYRSSFLLESLQMAYYGQGGTPKPIVPGIRYPANSIIEIDIWHRGTTTITNLTFYFRGVKLYDWGAVPGPTYPPVFKRGQTFSYPINVASLGVSETRLTNLFTCKQDADFVFRAGQGPTLFTSGGRTLAEIFITLKDADKNPYSNDFVHFDILFGSGAAPATIPVGATPSYISPFGTGPAQPGLVYPEIYIPKNQQLIYDLQRADGSGGSNQSETFNFNLIGMKVFQ